MAPIPVHDQARKIACYPNKKFKEWVIAETVPKKNPDGSMQGLICGGPADLEQLVLCKNIRCNNISAGELFRYLFANDKWPKNFPLTPRIKCLITQAVFTWKIGAELVQEIRSNFQHLSRETYNTIRLTRRPSFPLLVSSTIPIITFVASLIGNSKDELHTALFARIKDRYSYFMEACRAFELLKVDPRATITETTFSNTSTQLAG